MYCAETGIRPVRIQLHDVYHFLAQYLAETECGHMLAGCLMWPLLVCVAALLIVSRSHYTIDIVIGYWLAIGLFIIYHMYCDVKVRHCERTDANLLFLTLVFEVSLRFCWCNSFFRF
jgi:hypothetical protein